MSFARKPLGWSAVIFGGAGIALCLGGIVLLWKTSHQTRSSVDGFAEKITDFTSGVHGRSIEARDLVGRSQQRVTAIETELRSALSGALEERGIEPGRLAELSEQIRELSAKLASWFSAAEASREFVTLLAEMVNSLSLVTGAPGQEELREALSSGLDQIGEAKVALETLATSLEQARDGTELTPADYQPLLQRFAESLGKLMLATDAFADRIAAVEGSAEHLRSRVNGQLFAYTLLGSMFLVWGAVGQFALAAWGWRTSNAKDPASGSDPTGGDA